MWRWWGTGCTSISVPLFCTLYLCTGRRSSCGVEMVGDWLYLYLSTSVLYPVPVYRQTEQLRCGDGGGLAVPLSQYLCSVPCTCVPADGAAAVWRWWGTGCTSISVPLFCTLYLCTGRRSSCGVEMVGDWLYLYLSTSVLYPVPVYRQTEQLRCGDGGGLAVPLSQYLCSVPCTCVPADGAAAVWRWWGTGCTSISVPLFCTLYLCTGRRSSCGVEMVGDWLYLYLSTSVLYPVPVYRQTEQLRCGDGGGLAVPLSQYLCSVPCTCVPADGAAAVWRWWGTGCTSISVPLFCTLYLCTGRRSSCGVETVGDWLYCVGGNDGTMCQSSGEKFSLRRNTWETIASMQSRR